MIFLKIDEGGFLGYDRQGLMCGKKEQLSRLVLLFILKTKSLSHVDQC
jgi:hypothetical protein